MPSESRTLLDFAAANFDRLKDAELNLITDQSLRASKFGFINPEQRAHVDELIRKLGNYGHVHRQLDDTGRNVVWALSEDDITRVRAYYRD